MKLDLFLSEESCVQLRIEMQYDSDSVIPQPNMDIGTKFGVEKEDALEVNKYVVAFLRKLLFQREKNNEHLLENSINRKIEKQWQEVVSKMEDTNRRLINIESGNLVFTLLCPTRESRLQLQDGTWKDEIQGKLTDLLRLLGKFYFAYIEKY